jgi:hypothetical protein
MRTWNIPTLGMLEGDSFNPKTTLVLLTLLVLGADVNRPNYGACSDSLERTCFERMGIELFLDNACEQDSKVWVVLEPSL